MHYTKFKRVTKKETFYNYSTIVYESKFRTNYGKGRPSDISMRIKILTPKQMLQRLPIALAQANAGNTSEKLRNEIRQVTCSLCRAREITETLYNNIMNSIKL